MPTVSLTNFSNTQFQLIIDGNTYLLKKVNTKTAVSGNYILLFYQEVETNAFRQQWKLLYSDFTDPTAANAVDLKAKIDFIIDSYANYTDLVLVEVKNTSGSPISKGTPVYITGTVGATDVLTIAPADASNSAKMPATGLVYSTLANNEFGHVIVTGLLTQITTNPIDGLTPTVNQTVYVKPGGGLTLTKPTGTNLIQNVGKVGRVNGGGAGSIAVANIQRSNDIPNLAQNNIWIGNASGVPTAATLSGDVTNSAGVVTIANDAVTYAKMQNVSAASRLLGRGDSGAGDVQEITLGSGLSMSGTTLSSSGGGVTTIGTIDSQTKAANGAVISGSSLVMQTADGISPGLVSTVSQTFAGLKTFSGNIISGTVTGSTSASGTLTLSSTSNATKGKLLFGTSAYDEVNNRLGIGTASPSYRFHLVSSLTASSGSAISSYIDTTLTAAANNDTLIGLNIVGTFNNGAFTGVNNWLQSWYQGATLRSFIRSTGLQQWNLNNNVTEAGRIEYGTPSGNTGMAIFDWDAGTSTYINRYNFANEGTYFYQGFHLVNNLGGMALFNTTHNLVLGYTGTPTDAGYKLDINGTTRSVTSVETPIVRGSTSASGTLTLSSTSNATKGNILFGTLSAYDEVNDRLGIGTTTPTAPIDSIGTDANRFRGLRATNSTGSAIILFQKSRGTIASPLAVLNGDGIGVFNFGGYDGTAFTNTAFFGAICEGTPSSGTIPICIAFTTGTTVANRTERMRIGSAGSVMIGTTVDAGYNLDINGTTRTQGDFTISDAKNIILATTTGTKIGTATSQKLSFWNATPIVQPTTAVAAATRVGGGGTTVTDTDTFDGYTIAQIVKALRNTGILA